MQFPQFPSRPCAAVLALAAMVAGTAAQATTVGLTQVSATPGISDAAAAIDGVTPADGTAWDALSAHWSDSSAETLVYRFDQAYQLSSAVVTTDWNDVYKFEVSTDGSNYTTLFVASGLWGQQNSSVGWGQVTLPVSFALTALSYNYLRVTSVYGDGARSIGELSLQGVAAVPEPETWALMGAGLGFVGLRSRRRSRA